MPAHFWVGAPDDAHLHYNLAVLYDEQIRDKQKAIHHYRSYVNLAPEAEDIPKVMYWIKEAERDVAIFSSGIGKALPNSR